MLRILWSLLLSLVLLSLGRLLVTGAAGERVEPPSAVSRARSGPLRCTRQGALWHFHAASPLAGAPVVTRQGVFVASLEGYLHALRPDGGFRWSYTVEGALLQALTVDRRGRINAVSSTGAIYSMRPSGKPNWVLHSPVVPESPLWVGQHGAGYFVRDKFLFGVSSRAGLLWRADLGARVTSELSLGKAGRVWLLTADGVVHAIRTPGLHDRFRTPGGPGSLLQLGERVALVQGGVLSVLNLDGTLSWKVDSVLHVSPASKGQLGATAAGRLKWLELATGSELASASFQGRPSARPLFHDGLAFVPTQTGQLLVVERGGKELQRCELSSAPLLEPQLSPDGRQLVVGSGDGQVVSLELPGSGKSAGSRRRKRAP